MQLTGDGKLARASLGGVGPLVLLDYSLEDADAFVADEDLVWPGHQTVILALALATERAAIGSGPGPIIGQA